MHCCDLKLPAPPPPAHEDKRARGEGGGRLSHHPLKHAPAYPSTCSEAHTTRYTYFAVFLQPLKRPQQTYFIETSNIFTFFIYLNKIIYLLIMYLSFILRKQPAATELVYFQMPARSRFKTALCEVQVRWEMPQSQRTLAPKHRATYYLLGNSCKDPILSQAMQTTASCRFCFGFKVKGDFKKKKKTNWEF